jgi:hypothetical protein
MTHGLDNSSHAYDMYNITKPEHVVSISGDVVSNIALGTGLDMDDPLKPMPAPLSPFLVGQPTVVDGSPIDIPSILSSQTSFIEDASDYELATTLYANMGASFGFASLSAACSYSRTVQQKSDAIVALISQTTTGEPIPVSSINWRAPPNAESDAVQDSDRLAQFIEDYRSHYVQAITYGYRIAVLGTIRFQKGGRGSVLPSSFQGFFW